VSKKWVDVKIGKVNIGDKIRIKYDLDEKVFTVNKLTIPLDVTDENGTDWFIFDGHKLQRLEETQ
jgi:hypothetical protein